MNLNPCLYHSDHQGVPPLYQCHFCGHLTTNPKSSHDQVCEARQEAEKSQKIIDLTDFSDPSQCALHAIECSKAQKNPVRIKAAEGDARERLEETLGWRCQSSSDDTLVTRYTHFDQLWTVLVLEPEDEE